jgi:hypothetical protein
MANFRLAAGLVAAFFVLASVSESQQERDSALKSLSFLSGRWVSEAPDQMQEELWTPVTGDSITGSFRILKQGSPVFYEFWVVEVNDNRPVLKMKHFSVGLVGWEDKTSSTQMPLITAARDDATFAASDGSVSLHYHRAGSSLTCIVHHVRNGKISEETFSLDKAPLD